MHHRPDIEDSTDQGERSPRKRPHSRRLAKVALLGGFVALLTRSGVRGRVLDKLFGPEEEFEYESETEPEPLSDLSADPGSAEGDSDDHDEQEHDEPAGDEPEDAARESWEPAAAPDAMPPHADDAPAPPEDPEPAHAPEPPLGASAPRIFAVPSVPATDPPRDQGDAPPTDGDAVEPYARASYVPTPPASYVPDPPASDVPGEIEPEPPQAPSAPPESPPERDRSYSWGGDTQGAAVGEILGLGVDEEAQGDEDSPAAGDVTTTELPRPAVTDGPLPRADELTNAEPSRVAFAPPGDSPLPARNPLVFSRDEPEPEREAPAPAHEVTSNGSQWAPAVESPGRPETEAPDDGAPAEPHTWALAPPFVIGEEPPAREPDAEPWRTAPSIVIENGDLILDPEPDVAVATPRSAGDTNGGGTQRPWAGSDAPEPRAEPGPAFGTIASDDEETPSLPTVDSRSSESLAQDELPEAFEPASTAVEPAAVGTEPTAAAVEPAVLATEPVAAPLGVDPESTVAASEPAPATTEPAVGATEPDASAESAIAARQASTAPVSSESAATSVASAENAVATEASTDGAVATAVRGEPGIGEAAPRRSGWWLSRRRRGAMPEPPRWD